MLVEAFLYPRLSPRTDLVLMGEKVWQLQDCSYPSPLPFAPIPSPLVHSMRTKGALLQCLYCITGASWPDCPLLGKVKNKKTKKYLPSPPPPSPTTAQQCLNTPGDENNLQKWSRNYIMNCPSTRHIVGFLVNQIFLRNYMNFFDYIKDNRRIGFPRVTTGHQSHMLQFVRKQGCFSSQVAGARARLSS